MNKINVIEVGTKTQLLLDDHLIDDVWMVRRAPETPVKHLANPILPNSGGTVIYDREDKIFKMWYGIPIPGTHEARGAYAFSSDGVNWEKPELGLVEYNGSRKNNVLTTNGFGHVLKDPRDPNPNRRYKMMTKRKATAVSDGRAFAAFSPDGIHWQDHPGEKSIVRGSSDGNGCVLYDESSGRYINFRRPTIRAGRPGDWTEELGMPETRTRKNTDTAGKTEWELNMEEDFAEAKTGKGFPSENEFVWHEEAEDYIHRYLRKAPYVNTRAIRIYGKGADKACNRRIARAESEDFINWTEPQGIIMPDELDPPKLYSMPVVRYLGFYLGFLNLYNSWGKREYPGCPQEPETMDTQLAFSRDGWRWERLANRPVFIPRGLIGSFDGGMLSSVRMVPYGEDLLFYYNGSNHSHNVPGSIRGLGLARLPKERLVARTAGDEPGMLITKPFRLEGQQLMINANAAGGAIRAEMTDAIGNPLPGFEAENCRNVESNDFRIPLQWLSENKLEQHRGEVVRIRFFLARARLYAFIFC